MNLRESILEGVDSILEIRAELGADLRPIYLVTRAWSGRTVGEGAYTEQDEEVLPTPRVVALKRSRRVVQSAGGTVEADLIIKGISKRGYPSEDELGRATSQKNIEKFYKVGDDYYELIATQERHVTWDIWLKRKTDQRR